MSDLPMFQANFHQCGRLKIDYIKYVSIYLRGLENLYINYHLKCKNKQTRHSISIQSCALFDQDIIPSHRQRTKSVINMKYYNYNDVIIIIINSI